MKRLFLVLTLLVGLLLLKTIVFAAEPAARYASCDACGFCPMIDITNATCSEDTRPFPTGNPAPGNWKNCAKCLYPALYPTNMIPDPKACLSVKVDPATNMPPRTATGRQYTMLGCLTSNGGFENNKGSGASSFVQALFDLLVFRITGGIAFLYLMYGAFLVLTSQAEPEKLNYGRRVIIGAVVGLIFALSSVFIVNLIGSGILKLPGFGAAPTLP